MIIKCSFFPTELDWTLFPSAIIGHKGLDQTYAIDGMIDGMFRSDKNNYKWIEITLPDFILVPQVKFFSVGDSTKYYTNLDVRVGNTSTTPTTTNVASTDNLRCEYKVNTPSNFEFLVFTCPSPGIIGNTISVQKHSGEEMRGQEIQVYGKYRVFFNFSRMFPNPKFFSQFEF